MARGASAAKALMVVADRSSYPIDQIAAQAKCPLWYQVYLEPDMKAVRTRVERAVGAGCKALCVTVNAGTPGPPIDCGHRLERDRPFAQRHRRAPCAEGRDESG